MDLVSVWHLEGLVAFHCWCFYTTYRQIQKAEQKQKSGCLELYKRWDRGVMLVESSALGTLRSGQLWLRCVGSSSLKWHKNTSLNTQADQCDNVFERSVKTNSEGLLISFYKCYLRPFLCQTLPLGLGMSLQGLCRLVELRFSRAMFHGVSVLYSCDLCCGSVFNSRNMKRKEKFENVLALLYLYALYKLDSQNLLR